MTKRHETNEDIRRSIAEIDKRLEAHRELRVSLGLPPNRPAYFVEASHSRAMVDRVRVVASVLTSYLGIINDGKRLVPFPVQTFTDHLDLLTLIKWSKDMSISRYADLLIGAIDVIKDEENTYEKVVTKLYHQLDYAQKFLELADDGFHTDSMRNFDGTYEELDGIIADYQRHYDEVVAPQLAHEKAVLEKDAADKGGEII